VLDVEKEKGGLVYRREFEGQKGIMFGVVDG
jgi:hypothetical protein